MSRFDEETCVTPVPQRNADALTPVDPSSDRGPAAAASQFSGHVGSAWNIGGNPNGGYLLAIAAQALRQTTPDQPDPLSITAHYLLPGLADQACRVDTQVLRRGRNISTLRATLAQDGGVRLALLAAMGALGDSDGKTETMPSLSLPKPEIPPPEDCVGRSGAAQGVVLPILGRLEIRLHPQQAMPGASGQATVSGWIRFADGRPPDALACLLMADAFPPAVFGLLGAVGWVPTIELTVHLRRRPVPGWLLGQFWTHDLSDGRLVEDGALWDSDGQLVAQSRQLALVRSR